MSGAAGCVVAVTGADRGIGPAIALAPGGTAGAVAFLASDEAANTSLVPWSGGDRRQRRHDPGFHDHEEFYIENRSEPFTIMTGYRECEASGVPVAVVTVSAAPGRKTFLRAAEGR